MTLSILYEIPQVFFFLQIFCLTVYGFFFFLLTSIYSSYIVLYIITWHTIIHLNQRKRENFHTFFQNLSLFSFFFSCLFLCCNINIIDIYSIMYIIWSSCIVFFFYLLNRVRYLIYTWVALDANICKIVFRRKC